MQVILTDEDEKSLRKYIYEIVIDEIKQARVDTAVDKRILNQTKIAKYFDVATKTIREWESLGLPYASIGSRKYYDKEECRKWLLSQKI